MEYEAFLDRKLKVNPPSLSLPYDRINEKLFEFQSDIVKWALRRGRAAIFADCGMGKTPMQLTWADNIPGPVIIVTPLAVAKQTVAEAKKFGIKCAYAKTQEEITERITVTNYDRLDNFDLSEFTGVVLDSAMSRQGIADYLVTMRKPGDNPEPVVHTNENFPVSVWQHYADPVWMDIDPSDTLQYMSARDSADERHICPLQLTVIRRAIGLWTNQGDTVFSPYAGIGSEGFCAVEMNRQFIGAELKESYYRQAIKNMRWAENERQQTTLFPEPWMKIAE